MEGVIENIAKLSRLDLLSLWSQLFGEPVPKQLSQNLMRQILAFEHQTQRLGGLPATLVSKLDRIDTGAHRAKTPGLKVGSKLLREWNGVSHCVEIAEDGFRWRDKHFRSLSAVARAITGAHWSGPRFFGLTKGIQR